MTGNTGYGVGTQSLPRQLRTMPSPLLTVVLVVPLLMMGCTETEPVVINAEDVTYNGSTVKDEIDKVKKQGSSPHKHKASEITDFDSAAVNAMGVKTNTNPLKHDRYGETDLAASATIKALQTENTTLKSRLTSLEQKVAALTGASGCPPEYTRDTKVTKYTVCKKGKDEIVKVGDFWIDRYETQIVDSATFASGKCNGSGKSFGMTLGDYTSKFPESGNWTNPLYACSVAGITPSTYMTWFQAQQACALAGKHLCTNDQWQAAAAGTPDTAASCNISGTPSVKSITTGKWPLCISNWGAMDMVGSVTEWVAWWGQAGTTWMTKNAESSTPWPSSYGSYGDGQDKTMSNNGSVSDIVGQAKGIPAAAIRGGSWNHGTAAGVFHWNLNRAPSMKWGFIGARCCLAGGR